MNWPKIAVIFLTLLYITGTKATEPQTKGLVTLNVPEEVHVNQAKTGELKVKISVKDGYHVQANPASQEFLIPVNIENISAEGISFGKPEYPVGNPFKIETSDDPLSVYDGKFIITLPFETANDSEIAQTEVNGTFRYQTCDAKRCYFPRSIEFSVPVKIINK
ncbi:MAG: hypothetical protein GWO07_10835 [Candidatus Dadabacteria bacterium]|nr:hypothetical protein [Candidatus Dadabacteria bacterium]NIS09236.1 hypothetical protein [Candidatus Dadabacteria bacterium]NIV41884.1 hypothetical protein [Candidatus Dadabacteria bacterium]NIX15782.1 hypothetical protein [Candidatus Dadabacteria bacterium]NIY22512.1 hypothetical protein [Candidatus Dadabacteria bacterium]